MDEILVQGVRAAGRHGVHAYEKQVAQPFVADAALRIDLRAAGRSDDLTDSVSYSAAARVIRDVIGGETRNLVEALAESIARELLLLDARIVSVRVTVKKPNAPIPGAFDWVGVTVERTREDLR